MPVCWQGWTVLFGYLGLVSAGIVVLMARESAGALALYLLALTAALLVILAWKGERPLRWRWGKE